ncbi:MAG TPA: hypothetical protein DCY03_10540, partial [Planctomycetaceae bacterium]|nr:hypothetical protein [Planctomycetaceae bacterium]
MIQFAFRSVHAVLSEETLPCSLLRKPAVQGIAKAARDSATRRTQSNPAIRLKIKGDTMPKMEFDFQGLIQLLAKNLYSEKRVFIRELIQNAHDGILRRQSREPDAFSPRIDVESRPDELQFIIRDNGLGMDLNDIREYLAVIGRGATRLEKGDVTGLVGQFGIGFLSAFIVAERVEVETRKVGDDDGW